MLQTHGVHETHYHQDEAFAKETGTAGLDRYKYQVTNNSARTQKLHVLPEEIHKESSGDRHRPSYVSVIRRVGELNNVTAAFFPKGNLCL